MAEIVRKRRLVNPGRRRRNPRKMSALQKLFFGSKRQRASVKANRNPRRRRRNIGYKKFIKRSSRRGVSPRSAQVAHRLESHERRTRAHYRSRYTGTKYNPRRRRRNVSSIVTVYPVGMNPGRRHRRRRVVRRRGGVTVARRRRRARVNPVRRRRVHHRRRRNYGTQVGRSWSSYKVRGRRRNPSRRRRRVMHHRRHYRRNPGMLGSTMQSILGVMGGVALTKTICTLANAQFPQFSTGIIGYLATGIIAVGQGKLIGKVLKSPVLGHNFMVGGLAYLTSKILNDFLPALGGYGGIGLIGGNNFYVPQVNQNGSMGSFVLPGAVSGAIGSAMVPATTTTGVRGLRRTGRLM